MPNSLLGDANEDKRDIWPEEKSVVDEPLVPVFYMPETTEETVRRGGLAWSAGIIFFFSVAFTLFLGWIADVLFGTKPWGLVGGIVLGSIIGFIQFFRITSQIFNTNKKDPAMRPLLKRDEDENWPH